MNHPKDTHVGPFHYCQTSWLNFGLQTVFHTKRFAERLKNELKPRKVVGGYSGQRKQQSLLQLWKRFWMSTIDLITQCNPWFARMNRPSELIGETRVPILMSNGHDRKCDYQYKRFGVCNIFLANEPLAGFRMVKVTWSKCKVDWAEFIKELED